MGYLVTATFTEDYPANVGGLGDKRTKTFVVDRVANRALVHNQRGLLGPLRSKIEQYADPERVSEKTGLPRNAPLVAPLESVQLATLTDLSDGWLRPDALDSEEHIWLELWAAGGRLGSSDTRERVRSAIREFLEMHELFAGPNEALEAFAATEHDIYMLELSGAALMDLPTELPDVYHLTPPQRPIVPLLLDQQADMELPSVSDPSNEASIVAILDTGMAENHPLLEKAMASPGASAVPGDSSAADSHGHGTRMAGAAAYHDLAEELASGGALEPRCRLQNLRVITGHDGPSPEFMLARTEDAVLEAEQTDARQRIFSLSLGSATPRPGDSTPWSVAVDQLAYADGFGRVFCVAAGNRPTRGPIDPSDYPVANLSDGLTSPAEAVNAVTVGAITNLQTLDGDETTRQPLATAGQLCPVSRCDVGGSRPIKPDVVTEGGNWSTDGTGCRADRAMQLLTTDRGHATGPWLTTTNATSAATAHVAGMLAEIWAANPGRRSETVRGLLVHSARWTDEMIAQLPNPIDRRRAFGFGQPVAEAAAWSDRPRPTLILEDTIHPERNFGDGREMHFLSLPMPEEELTRLGDTIVEVSITLSYFIEPNEKRVVRYHSAGLRWGLQRPLETEDDFRKRINKLERDRDDNYENTTEDLPWELGPQTRGRGTVQSDRARVTANELSGGRGIAIWPVAGWWRDRGVREDAGINYSLIVTLDAGEEAVDLYTPILNEVTIRTEIA